MAKPKKMDEKTLRQTVADSYQIHSKDGEYAEALGKFMIAWSDVEKELYRVLVAYAGVSDAVGRAIFSGTRMKGMLDFIKSIDHNSPFPIERSADLAHVFPQISVINSMRDHLIHHSTDSYSYKDANTRVVATARASRYGKNVGYEISAQTIEAMTYDLYGIRNHLNMHHGNRSGPFMPWREESPDDGPTPWTYKSPQPIDSWETPPEGAQKSPLQRKSSPK